MSQISIMREFLLFESSGFEKYAYDLFRILKTLLLVIVPVALFFDQLKSSMPRSMQILKNYLIASALILMIPHYYHPVAQFGLNIGDSLLKDTKTGIVGSWGRLRKAAEQKAHEGQSTEFNLVSLMFKIDTDSIIEKATTLLLFLLFFLLKMIYTIVYYYGYIGIAFFALLNVFDVLGNYLIGALKSVLYIIFSAIVISFVLVVINDFISFTVNAEGFISNLEGFAKLVALGFVLLGSMSISLFILNGKGAENWAGSTSSMLGSALMYKAISSPFEILKGSAYSAGKSIENGAKSVFSPINRTTAGAISSASYIATKPISFAWNRAKSRLSEKGEQIINEKGGSFPQKNEGILKNKYETSFAQATGKENHNQVSTRLALNPINHAKASVLATKSLAQDFKQRSLQNIGIPQTSERLTNTEKITLMTNKAINGFQVHQKNQVNMINKEKNLNLMKKVNDDRQA